MTDSRSLWLAPRTTTLALVLAVLLGVAFACKRAAKEPTEVPKTPSARLYLTSTLAGAMEPCGCRKDMLGGVDHAAALIEQGRAEAPHSLVLGAGPLYFLNPELTEEKRQQDLWKAHGIASALADMKLAAWAPGQNDFAAGLEELAKLQTASGATLLAANLGLETPNSAAPKLGTEQVFDVGGLELGVIGVTELPSGAGLRVGEVKGALEAGAKRLRERGADVLVALVAAPRGEALRLAESVTGFSVMVVGKPFDRGEGNDAPTPPVLVGQTLVVQAPNHLQALAIVDLFVRDGKVSFSDGSGIETAERVTSLKTRIQELEGRIEAWRAEGKVAEVDLVARQGDLERMRQELASLSSPKTPPQGSFFTYDLREVREGLGSNERVLSRMRDYYKRVNDHNALAFKDRKPEPAPAGQAHYVGGARCIECHEEAHEFWKTTGHAKAYETLVVDFKEFNLDCVSCHVTGYEKPGGSTVTFVENLKDVQCEECHGPGSIHVEDEDVDQITLTPPKTLCTKCHHPPHVADDWDVEQAWKHIIGPGHGAGDAYVPPAAATPLPSGVPPSVTSGGR